MEATGNIFNRMYITTNNVLSGLDLDKGDPLVLPENQTRIAELVKLYNERISNRLVTDAASCMAYDAACLGLTASAAGGGAVTDSMIVSAFLKYVQICHVNTIPPTLAAPQKHNVLFLNPFFGPYDAGPFALADIVHDV